MGALLMNIFLSTCWRYIGRAAKGRQLVLVATGFMACVFAADVQAQKSKPAKAEALDPNTPVEKLLPTPPRKQPALEPVVAQDLAEVPELTLHDPLDKILTAAQAREQIANLTARINLLDKKKTDGFILALVEHRADLRGLPFLLGQDCRQSDDSRQAFTELLSVVRVSMPANVVFTPEGFFQTTPATAAKYWKRFDNFLKAGNFKLKNKELLYPTLTDILMQAFGPESVAMRKGMIDFLASVNTPGSTKALARLVIFSPEPELHIAAHAKLKFRNPKDYAEILLRGLRYPWPDVVERSAMAIIALERVDLVPKLITLLDAPDPRLPQPREVQGKPMYVAEQLVRINHHQNCLLCHAPANSTKFSSDLTTAPVPLPGEKLPSPHDYMRHAQGKFSVRVDVTYLRQDFSRLQKVANAAPWADMQRFDFFVRTVTMSPEEAKVYEKQFRDKTAGQESPYQRALLTALRALTGRDAPPNAAAWRRMLADTTY
jgi:hypothetical protein